MLRFIPVISCLAFALFAGWAQADNGARDVLRSGYEEIQLRGTADNHLFISGSLEGRRRSFLVDSGWSFTTIATNALRHPAATNCVLLGEMSLGASAFTNQPALVQDMRFNGQRAAFDVVLGLDFLQREFAILDCDAKRLYVRRSAPTAAGQVAFSNALHRAGFLAVALALKEPAALTAEAALNGQSLEMLLDSGAACSCVDWRQAQRLGLKVLPSTARITGSGKTGQRMVRVAEVQSFHLGECQFHGCTLAVFDLGDWGFAAPNKGLREVQGILGGELLAGSRAMIDFDSRQLWVKPAPRRR